MVFVEVALVEDVDRIAEVVGGNGVVVEEGLTEVGAVLDPVDISTAEVAPTAAAEDTQVPATAV